MAATSVLQSAPSAVAALPPPPGETTRLATSPNDLAKWTILCAAMCMGVSSIPYGLRCYVRIAIKKSWLWEDYVGLIAYSSLMAYSGLILKLSAAGGGVHAWNLTLAQLNTEAYWFNVGTIVYAIAICSAKISILLLFRRVFSPTRYKPFDVFLLSFVALLLLFYVSTTLVKIFECTPRAKIWDKALPGSCVNVSSLLNTSGLFNTATDILILLIPIKAVWQLHMARKRKLLVVLIFTMGLIAPVVSTIGVVVRWQVSNSPDTSYNGPKILLWAGAEIASCVICVSLPELGALRPAALRSRKAGSKGTDYRPGYGYGHGYGDGNGNGKMGSRGRRPSGSAGTSMWPPTSPTAASLPLYHHAYPYPPPPPPPSSGRGRSLPREIAGGTYLEVVATPRADTTAHCCSLGHPRNHSVSTTFPPPPPSSHAGPTGPPVRDILGAYLRPAGGGGGSSDEAGSSGGSGGMYDDDEKDEQTSFAAWGYAGGGGDDDADNADGDTPRYNRWHRSPSEPPPLQRRGQSQQGRGRYQDEGIVKTVRIEWKEGRKGGATKK